MSPTKKKIVGRRGRRKRTDKSSDDTGQDGEKKSDGVEDLLQLNEFSEETLIVNLQKRYQNDSIYTFVGPILIAINPYKNIPDIYSEDTMTMYHGQPRGVMSPHTFVVADEAYTQLVEKGSSQTPANQAIIISGESGAGKTETTKIIMQYLARVTRSASSANSRNDCENGQFKLGKLEERVLDSNPLLESFGNAKTLRNDNSSRFGKFIEIQFNNHGKITGAKVMNFLLEKTRIITQSLGERNYHVFYQLLDGASENQKQKLNLKSPEEFHYLNQSNCFRMDHCCDKDDFEMTKHCMGTIGLSIEQQESVFGLLAAILHLGNIAFETKGENCCLANEQSEESLALVASLLQVPSEAFKAAICTRHLYVGGKTIVKTQTVDQAIDRRDALAKALYSSLFSWLVGVLNDTISIGGIDEAKNIKKNIWGFIGVLDIYGFEKFEWNTFEQLCINYANEKLQRHFNQHMLEVEQEEYSREGIDWQHISFNDNQACLDLIDSKPNNKPGIFIALDDVWRTKGEEANRKFVSYLHATFGRDLANNAKEERHAYYVHPKLDPSTHFGIRHYAGEVVYDASGFNDKNNEDLNDDIKSVIARSSNKWLCRIFQNAVQAVEASHNHQGNTKQTVSVNMVARRQSSNSHGGSGSPSLKNQQKLKEISVSAQFRRQLQELINKLSMANPRYIRCIKPNDAKKANDLVDAQCLKQLKYSGMMEAIRIRHQGFALREDHDNFFDEFMVLEPDAEDLDELVEKLSLRLKAGKEEWQIGETKIFLKKQFASTLKRMARLRVKSAARSLQKWYRFILRTRAAVVIQACIRGSSARRAYECSRHSAQVLTCIVRGFLTRKQYLRMKRNHHIEMNAASRIQALVRGVITRYRLSNPPDPFAGWSAKQLDVEILRVESAISEAMQNKNFALCSQLQNELDTIVEIRQTKRTRVEIKAETEILIAKVEKAANEKQFALCATLQSELDELQQVLNHMNADLNEWTAKELDGRLRELEEKMEKAVSARDFAECSNLQSQFDKVKKIRESKVSFQDVKLQLEFLHKEVEKAVQLKQFDKCAGIQVEIHDLEEQLKTFSPADKEEWEQELKLIQEKEEKKIQDEREAAKQQQLLNEAAITAPMGKEMNAKTVDVSSAYGNKTLPMPARPRTSSINSNQSAGHSVRSLKSMASTTSTNTPMDSRTVAQLRPAKALTLYEHLTIAQAAKEMKPSRTDAALIISKEGFLIGIFTETDVTRRVVSCGLSVKETLVSEVMTSSPKCVHPSDSAIEALSLMLKGRFRHLPVVDESGYVVGMLNVAKCLYDAIRWLEDKKTVMASTAMTNKKKKNTKLGNLLGSLMDTLLEPSLEQVITQQNDSLPPVCFGEDKVVDVVRSMASSRKAALIISSQSDEIIGIFTPKDLLLRVVAEGLSVEVTDVYSVMTPHPEVAYGDTKVLAAFHILHEGSFLNLPVVHSPAQPHQILGMADVFLLAQGSITDENSNLSWTDAFLAQQQNHEISDETSSVQSGHSSVRTSKSRCSTSSLLRNKNKNAMLTRQATVQEKKNCRLVKDLRISPAFTLKESQSIKDACFLMQKQQTDALLILSHTGHLAGILTDTDIASRVVAKSLSPSTTHIRDVMTRNPLFVAPDDSALDAILRMHEGKFRHLPVVNDSFSVEGLLRIEKCLYDVIRRVEMTKNKVKRSSKLSPMMEMLFSPKISTILGDDDGANTIVEAKTSVKAAVHSMAKSKKALCVVSNGLLVGIFSPLELIFNVLVPGLNPDITAVGDAMSYDKIQNVTYLDMPVLDAMHIMQETKDCLNLAVLNPDNQHVMGIVDVLTLSSLSSKESKESFWEMALAIEEEVEDLETRSMRSSSSYSSRIVKQQQSRSVSQLRPSRALTLLGTLTVHEAAMEMRHKKMDAAIVISQDGCLDWIVNDIDLIRRVFAGGISSTQTFLNEIMTRNPKCVSVKEDAMEALFTMLEGKFRHLPVVSNEMEVVGMLNIGKCLYDAIRKLETKTKELGKDLAQRLFSPTISAVLKRNNCAASRVSPSTSVLEAAKLMASTRQAVLVVDDEDEEVELLGLCTPSDILTYVLSKKKKAHLMSVWEILQSKNSSSKPIVTVSSTSKVVDAMHLMHDQQTLYLGVVDDDEEKKKVMGCVDVLGLSYGSFTMHGQGDRSNWGAFWNTAFNVMTDDDMDSDTASNLSWQSSKLSKTSDKQRRSSVVSKQSINTGVNKSRSVAKLRPCSACTVSWDMCVFDAARKMKDQGADAALVLEANQLVGILTDTDVTRRVVSLQNDPHEICVNEVMTASPVFVTPEDNAVDALFQMLKGKFRHLPVVDANNNKLMMLRIQKCLYDAIKKMDFLQQNSHRIKKKLQNQLEGGMSDEALEKMVAPLVSKLLSPSLSNILSEGQTSKRLPLVSCSENVTTAAQLMARYRTAVLVVNHKRSNSTSAEPQLLLGILTPKDVLLRVVAANLDAYETTVEQVMTRQPESAPPETTVLEALEIMREHHFLHLPVVSSQNKIMGLVDVLSLSYGSFAQGGDMSEWQQFWDLSMLVNEDEIQEEEDQFPPAADVSLRNLMINKKGRASSIASSHKTRLSKVSMRSTSSSVHQLRPKKVLEVEEFITVAEACRQMKRSRCEAAVVVNDEGILRGIVTDSDILRKVLAVDIHPEACGVAQIMTENPMCVSLVDNAGEALEKMLKGRFKHLPVVDDKGFMMGMLDISKCLYDTIKSIEKAQEASSELSDELMLQSNNSGAQNVQKMLHDMMKQMAEPTLAMAVVNEPMPPICAPEDLVSEVVKEMAATRKAAVIMDDGDLLGMLTPKDLMRKLVARDLAADTTVVSEVMTRDVKYLSPDDRILDGLHLMHETKELFVPIVKTSSRNDAAIEIVGMADVLSLSFGEYSDGNSGTGGSESGSDWRSFWRTALDLREEQQLSYSSEVGNDETNSIGTIEEFERGNNEMFLRSSTFSELGESASMTGANNLNNTKFETSLETVQSGNNSMDTFLFKIKDTEEGHVDRIRCGYDKLQFLLQAVAAKKVPHNEIMQKELVKKLVLKYTDDEGDVVPLTTDESLLEAVELAKEEEWKSIPLIVEILEEGNSGKKEESLTVLSPSKPKKNSSQALVGKMLALSKKADTTEKKVSGTLSDGLAQNKSLAIFGLVAVGAAVAIASLIKRK